MKVFSEKNFFEKLIFIFVAILFFAGKIANPEPLLKTEAKYEAKYKKDEIRATLTEGAKLATDFFRASAYAKQNPNHDPISDTFRAGFSLASPEIETDAAFLNFGASALSVSYDGIFSRLKNPERLLTSSSPLSTSLNLPRSVKAHLPTLTSARQKNSAHLECSAETDRTESCTDFTAFEDDSFVASGAEILQFPKFLVSSTAAAFRTSDETRADSSLAFSSGNATAAAVIHSVLTETELSLCALGAASIIVKTRQCGVYTIQGSFFEGTEMNKIKNMQSCGLICDFFKNRVRIGTRAIRTEKEAESTLNFSFGLRFRADSFAASLKLTDVLEKPSAALSVSEKLENGLRISASAKAVYAKSSDTLTASVKTGIRTEDCALADLTIGASEKMKDGETQKRTFDSGVSFSFSGAIRCIAKLLFSAEF